LNATSRYQLQVGIGIATGEVLAGCMGSVDRLNYTVLGERVNLGSRLCDAAGSSEVLIDDATRTVVGDLIPTEKLTPMSLHGFSQPVPVYRVRPGLTSTAAAVQGKDSPRDGDSANNSAMLT
jgi:class 3 adenylate cyclase